MRAQPPMEMIVELSPRQLQVLAFINLHRKDEQCNPTCSEIANHFNWRSPNAAQEILDALARKGAVVRRPGQKSRGYKVLRSYEATK